jgi:hypothetical protein
MVNNPNSLISLAFIPETGIAFVIKILVFIFLVMYLFFSLFLYLRIRILALTLQTENSPLMSLATLLNLIFALGYVILMSLLLLL